MPVVVTDIFESRLVLTDVDKYVGQMRRSTGAVRELEDRLDRLNRVSFATGAAAGVIGAGLGKAVGSASRMQMLSTGFKTILGDADAAKEKIKELQDFADRTPFSMMDVASGFQGLRGANLETGKILPLMEAMGNIMLANGKNAEDMSEGMNQVIQTIALGKVEMDELRVIAQRGIPMGEMLKELGPGKHTAEELVAALIKLGNSAKYAKTMENQSGTLALALSNLSDASVRLGDALGAPLLGPLTAGTQLLTRMAKAVGDAPGPVRVLASGVGVLLAGGLGVASLATKVMTFETMRLLRAQILLEAQAKKTGASVAASAVASAAGGKVAANVATGDALRQIAVGSIAPAGAGYGVVKGLRGPAAAARGFEGPAAWAARIGKPLSETAGATAATTAVASTAARTGIKAGLMAGLRIGAKAIPVIGAVALAGEAAYLGYEWWNADSSKKGSAKGRAAIGSAAGGDPDKDRQIQVQEQQLEVLKKMHGAVIKPRSGPASARDVLDGATIYRALGRSIS